MAAVKDHSNINYAFIIPLFCFMIVFLYSTIGHKWVIYEKTDIVTDVVVVVPSKKSDSTSITGDNKIV